MVKSRASVEWNGIFASKVRVLCKTAVQFSHSRAEPSGRVLAPAVDGWDLGGNAQATRVVILNWIAETIEYVAVRKRVALVRSNAR